MLVAQGVRFAALRSSLTARRFFRSSVWYLPGLLALMLINHGP